MNHTESSIKVYHTRNYGWFKTINGNRQLNEAKIKRIQRDINNGIDVLRYCPVIVAEKDGRLEIIDGQHRFYVAMQLKSPVWYIISHDMSLVEIARINSNTEKWKDADFINCYIQQGNKHYETLQRFMDDYSFNVSASILLLERGVAGEGGNLNKQRFQEGGFVVKKLHEAQAIAEMVKKFADFPGHTSSSFITAICKIMQANKIDIDALVEKWQRNKDALQKQPNTKLYLSNLETIYNQHARQRVEIW